MNANIVGSVLLLLADLIEPTLVWEVLISDMPIVPYGINRTCESHKNSFCGFLFGVFGGSEMSWTIKEQSERQVSVHTGSEGR